MQARALDPSVEFEPQGVANVLWALAKMGTSVEPALLEAMLTRATAMDHFNLQERLNLLWALAVLGDCDRAAELLDSWSECLAEEPFSHVAQLPQIHQVLLTCELDGVDTPAVQAIREQLGAAALEAFRDAGSRPSRMQIRVAKSLRKAFPEADVDEEVVDERSGYDIDIVVRMHGERWAVEVDGPWHFVKGTVCLTH